MTPREIERLLYCFKTGLPHPIIVALLLLAEGEADLEYAWSEWYNSDYWKALPYYDRDRYDMHEGFSAAVANVADLDIHYCPDCHEWVDVDDTTTVHDGTRVCDSCLSSGFSECSRCSEWFPDGHVNHVQDQDDPFCEACMHEWCEWCSECEIWTRYGCDNEHEPDACDCSAPNMRFWFPANGQGSVSQDERLDVTLPAGHIDDAGLNAIRILLVRNIPDNMTDEHGYRRSPHTVVYDAMEAIGETWQGKKGNYTRRLSRELYSRDKVKLPEGIISEVGNLARQHSSATEAWPIEFTRNLNLSAEDFAHDESCWWQSYFESRCALKQWGGLGIRMFDENNYPIGRAWVQPMDENLEPSHNTMTPHAYIVYNCYGSLDGAKAARIVAHLTSRTYCKVDFRSDPQYINSDMGWLVADESTCQNTNRVHFAYEAHDTLDAHDLEVAT